MCVVIRQPPCAILPTERLDSTGPQAFGPEEQSLAMSKSGSNDNGTLLVQKGMCHTQHLGRDIYNC